MDFIKKLLRTYRYRIENRTPLITIRIHKKRIQENLRVFQKRMSGVAVSPVLKSNAYGHGLLEVARIIDTEEIPFITVDSHFEAQRLRESGIKHSILVLGYSHDDIIAHTRLPHIAFTIIAIDQLIALKEKNIRARIHLKIDTGMHRQGILPSELPHAFKIIHSAPRLDIEGICSHLACADEEELSMTHAQITLWNSLVDMCKRELPHIQYFHLAQTAGSFFSAGIKANVMRLGLGLYGITTHPSDTIDIKPALDIYTVISSTKKIHARETVGYNATFTAQKDMRIATIPLGYAEGLDRRLSNKGIVRIDSYESPIIGRVSMNITSIEDGKSVV